MRNVRALVVGEKGVGKTALLITFTENRFPWEYVPPSLDNYTTGFEAKGLFFNLALWELRVGPNSHYARLKKMSYPETDVFIACFSISDRTSFGKVKWWVEEARAYCPEAKVFVVLTKLDLRDDPATIEQMKELGETLISEEEGRELATEIGADKYMECSSIQNANLRELFEDVCYSGCMLSGVNTATEVPKKKKKECQIM